jgi:AcrR family transcriptional regulator
MDDAAPIRAGSAAWWLARTENTDDRPRRRRMLSLDLIADAALSVLDTEGAEALTMRRLAQHLECSQAALYRHVTSRDELVVVTMDRAMGLGLPPPPEGLDWRQTAEWQALTGTPSWSPTPKSCPAWAAARSSRSAWPHFWTASRPGSRPGVPAEVTCVAGHRSASAVACSRARYPQLNWYGGWSFTPIFHGSTLDA